MSQDYDDLSDSQKEYIAIVRQTKERIDKLIKENGNISNEGFTQILYDEGCRKNALLVEMELLSEEEAEEYNRSSSEYLGCNYSGCKRHAKDFEWIATVEPTGLPH